MYKTRHRHNRGPFGYATSFFFLLRLLYSVQTTDKNVDFLMKSKNKLALFFTRGCFQGSYRLKIFDWYFAYFVLQIPNKHKMHVFIYFIMKKRKQDEDYNTLFHVCIF